MSLMRPPTSSFLFCDLDGASLDTIKQSAGRIGYSDDHIVCVQDDGVKTVMESASQLSSRKIAGAFVHIDPYQPFRQFDPSETYAEHGPGLTTMDLFCQLTNKGVRTLLWHGYESGEDQTSVGREIRESLGSNAVNSSKTWLWCGEITLRAMSDPDFDLGPGLGGCGVTIVRENDLWYTWCDSNFPRWLRQATG